MADAILRATGATREDLAWAAGLFEGEGCISISGSGPSFAPSCCMANADEDVMRRFFAIIGVGSLRLDRRSERYERRKDLWTWRVSGYPSTQYAIALLWRWLGERRRARGIEILTRFRSQSGRRRRQCKRGHDLTLPNARNSAGNCRACGAILAAAWYARGGKEVRKRANAAYWRKNFAGQPEKIAEKNRRVRRRRSSS